MDKASDKYWTFLKTNHRPPKPRSKGLTEVRGTYYTVVGNHYLNDVLDLMGNWIDSIKFAGGAFTLFPYPALKEFIETAHQHDVKVSTGGFMEYVLTQGNDAVHQYIQTCREAGF